MKSVVLSGVVVSAVVSFGAFSPKPLGGTGSLTYSSDFSKKPVFRAAPVRQPGLVLIDGDRLVTVVTPDRKERPDLWKLGQELQYHLEEMSGRKIPHVETAKRPAKGPVIVIGNDETMDAKGTMVIRRAGDELYLGGGAEGPSHALTYVLEALGCRYLWPGKTGKVIPKKTTVVLPEIDLAIDPDLNLVRSVKLGNPGDARSKTKILPAYGYDVAAYCNLLLKSERGCHDKTFNRDFWGWHGVSDAGVVRYRTYVHGGAVGAGHYFNDYYAKYSKEHPDWFAEQPNGSRVNSSKRPRLCLSNEELIREVIRDRVAALKANTNLVAVSISQPDGSYDTICYCENCRRLDVEDQEMRKIDWIDRRTKQTDSWEYPFVTDRVLTFANKVMEGVARECPGKHLGIFSYSSYDRPPRRVRPHPDLIFFNVAGDYRRARDCDWARKSLAAWLSFGNPIVWRPNCMNFLRAEVPCDVSRKIFTDIELAKANGCVGVSLDCVGRSNATRPLTFYLTAKAFLNPDRLDYEWYANDFCAVAFGPAASVMRSYFDELQVYFDRVAAEVPNVRNVGRYVAQFDLAHFQAILDRAKAMAKDAPDVLERLAFLQIALTSAGEVKSLCQAWDSGDRKRLDLQRERFKTFIRESNMKDPNALSYPGFRTPFMAGGVRGKGIPSLVGEADDRGNVITEEETQKENK